MEDVDLRHAKEHLEELIERAARGEDVRISDPKYGTMQLKMIERASARSGERPERRPGRWKGRIHIPDDALLAPLEPSELTWLSGEASP